MRLFFALLLLAAPLFAQTCDYNVQPPTALSIPSSASRGQISVTTGSTCAWTATSSVTWLTFDAMQGNGSGSVTYTAQANPTAISRTGIVTVASRQITVTQAAAQCAYTLDKTSQNIGVAGGGGSFNITTGCVWQPVSNNPSFISVKNANTVLVGNGTVNFTVAANTCVYGRSGSILVNTTSGAAFSPVFGITQDGSTGNLTLNPASANAPPAASDGRITVTTGTGCTWSASSTESWLQITSGSGSGNGAITYHLTANNAATRTGTIHIGSLTFTVTQAAPAAAVPTIASVNSAANYRADAISPGEIVTLFGSNMGPSTLVTLQLSGGSVASFLAGTQVLFDGVPAPIIYTKDAQVSAVAPYGLAGKSSTKVQVIYNGVTSAAVTVPVQDAHPAIFTLDDTGLGPGAILNQDYSINASANPAARGSVVAIYATGGGVTNPALADGAITGATLPYLTQQVSVTIGNLDAHVWYAGGAPGSVAGLTQINAEVPAGVAPGIAPIVVKVGTYTSSAGVTLAVK